MLKVTPKFLNQLILNTFVLIFFSSFSSGNKEKTNPYFTCSKLEKTFLLTAAKKYKLEAIGSGGGMPDSILNSLKFSFFCRRETSLSEARLLQLNLIKEFYKMLEDFPELQPFLNEPNFPIERFGVTIIYVNHASDYFEQGLTGSFLCGGNFHYFGRSEEKFGHGPSKDYQSVKIFQETYNEALLASKSE